EFDVEGKVAAATVRAVCDNHWRIYVNGERVVQGDDWTVATTTDITDQLRPGRNVIAVHGWNDGGPAGLALRATWTTAAGTDVLVSDRDWRCSDDDPDGWNDVEFRAEGWPSATVLAALGARKAVWSRTLDADSLAGEAAPDAPQIALPALGLAGPGADGALELLQVPKAYGSWVSLCADDRGRLYASDQSRGLYRITPASGIGEESTIERVEVELDGAQGLCWFEGALYAVVAVRSPGFYRVRDTDGDDRLDQVELLREFSGTGEHGPHAVVPAPDGKNLILVIGNHVKPTEFSKGGPSYVWGEDRLLPKIEDPRGHARGRKAPGGYICRIDPDGKECELLCWGFRNTYDVAVLPDGRLYTYDADMEWDMGMPWYRPTRILEVVKGADYGWRSGSNKWPVDYPDSPIAVCDIGPGSPTGMVTHGGSVLALDWTFGTIYALPIGSREPVQWVTGQPFPVSDAVSVDGKLYVITGGRGLRTRLLRIDATPPQQTATAMPMAERGGRRELERLRGVLRYTGLDARTVLARLGESRFDFAEMDSEERVSWLRVHALALLRIDSVDEAIRRDLGARLLPLFPCGDDRVDADLAELLAFLDVPGLLEKAVPTLSPLRPAKPPEWAEVVKRNSSYGGAIQKMLDNMPPTPQIAIAYALRTVKHGWTLEQRRVFFTFLTEARTRSGGASYDGYLGKIIDAAWETCSPAEQSALAELVDKARAELPSFRATPPRGPGRDWQLGDAIAFVRGDTGKRDLAAGHNLFHAVGCASCHYFAGEGGNHGPDLTSLGNKFSAEEVIEAIIAPDRVISDQYAAVVVTKTDGSVILGRANSVDRGGVKYWDVVPAVAQAELQRIPASEVASVEPSKQSPMPAGLVDALSPGELRDLVAFLLSRGVR
ncbi:MAG: c-type cytochrome, partial [bacterium]|nr:c-type cytochrome [bacterium]